jgi:hypothetical protein
MTLYTPTGPWTNGSSPGISAAFLNALEQWLAYAADSNITSDGSGNLSIVNTGHFRIGAFNVLWSPSSGDLFINCPNAGGSHKLYLQVGGSNVFSVDISGNVRTLGSLTQNVTP